MRKYGIDNFKFTIIEECTVENIDDAEIFWIQFFRSWDHYFGYNIDLGGITNKIVSIETRIKMGNARRGKTHSIAMKKQMSIIKTGTKHTDESKKKMIKSRTGKKHSKKWNEAISKSHIGKTKLPHTESAKQKMSEQRRGENNVKAKLKNIDIPIIRELYSNGCSCLDISKQYNVLYNTIWKIISGRSWKNIS